MSTVTIVGGAGAVGRVAARTLAQMGPFDHVVVADRDEAAARHVVAAIGAPHVEAREVDAGGPAGLRAALEGSRVVLNCSGPFYRYALPVLRASLAAGCDYVDVCDDVDATLALLEQDQAVRDAGRIALIGMATRPG